MFLLGERLVTSPSDLGLASGCEFALLRTLDVKLGRAEAIELPHDAMLERTGALGDEHELRVLENYRERFPGGVVEFDRPERMDAAGLAEAAARSRDAFEARAPVVFQATFFDGSLLGFADFIVHRGDGVYEVQDAKLARSAKVTALLQLAAYVEQLRATDVPVADEVVLLLGDCSESRHRADDILPLYRRRRARLDAIVAAHLGDTDAVGWGDPRFSACGRCEPCAPEIEARRDIALVANLGSVQRARLADAGITTIDALAEASPPIDGMAHATVERLALQARLQLDAERGEPGTPPPVRLRDPARLAALPAPSEGDLYFDFEGDPLYTENGVEWNLDYLFGVSDRGDEFTAFWAHTIAEERTALLNFLEFVRARRAEHPGLRIYHYAPYERTHLASLAARHGVGEAEVDQLLREHVLVDLYSVVRQAFVIGSRSYSIKKLEPLYLDDDDDIRSGVTNAGDSVEEYARVRALLDLGETDAAQGILDAIEEYNRFDCRSTRLLHDWLLRRAADAGVEPGASATEEERLVVGPSPLFLRMQALLGETDAAHRTRDQTALALGAAAIDYHRREKKQHWWAHFARLAAPLDDWADTRDVFRVTDGEVERGWHREGRQRTLRRRIRLHGDWAPGSTVRAGQEVTAVYEFPAPFPSTGADPGAHSAHTIDRDGLVAVGENELAVVEKLPTGAEEYAALPAALTPGPPIRTANIEQAIARWAERVVDGHPEWPADAVSAILRREPARASAAEPEAAPKPDTDPIEQIIEHFTSDGSPQLAVQGPPGTGKTYIASHVIARLVREHGWSVAVTAQSHAVIENVLNGVVEGAELDAALVGKSLPEPREVSFTALAQDGQLGFAEQHVTSGFVLGGTVWDLCNPKRFDPGSIDLLVVDEAGQFALGNLIAAATVARRVLLVGDPQQLAQVNQGTHPEPVDESALGWLIAGASVLPPEHGVFLADTRRMSTELTAHVSRLSYEGRLRAHRLTGDRALERVTAGLHPVAVPHQDNATESPEEAARIVALVRSSIGLRWTDEASGRQRDPLGERDLIVISPYNAQVELLRRELGRAGFGGVRVGTVDKFQGQEAVIALLSLAASTAADAPRGQSFLLERNRLNVAISRAQWAAFLVYSPGLLEHLPATPGGVAELSRFITLVEGA